MFPILKELEMLIFWVNLHPESPFFWVNFFQIIGLSSNKSPEMQ
jgi:hypothetical protein